MKHTINMPALSPTMEEGKLERWSVKKGDCFKPGDIICEVETDKAIMDVEAVDEGCVHEILVPEKTEHIKVNTPILTFISDGDITSSSLTTPKVDHIESKSESFTSTANSNISNIKKAEDKIVQHVNHINSSPLARRLASEYEIDLASISGSGPNGRIIKKDIERFIENSFPNKYLSGMTNPDVKEAEISSDDINHLFAKDSYEINYHNNMRKTIANRLLQSKQNIPHFYVSIDCNIDDLLRLREQMNAKDKVDNEENYNKISVNDMILKALSLAMIQVPEANVSWTNNYMIHHKNVDISFAISIPEGIVTPIIRKVEQKSIFEISSEAKELIQRAKQRKLKPEEYQGGTTTVSNMGMFGIKNFSAIVNPPQSTILAVGAGTKKPIIQDDKIKIATIMNVNLSADHRSIDGAIASKLLSVFKKYIENPVWMLMQ
ncbi:pyruvate dehydrogenase complex dihydrolipoamide acetyltransferase [Candidatus Liberibacter americanus]|uniref:Acetyltransferase component of pyruvate dehydrogenase complex n=1 Tax=Candidatus Liberibacter americanus str. Sao Paulo TaxID=1261131 RepID=U6B527_9HYPH|nr:pyruvate dehydrogenase complex dihydrolipoamide acetyltransferase [Candidatus Liberibacter americanus]AHA27688.1 Dihydrolipoamide acyltransferase [Candidatus Liberibacter americanus str. Sao Paulo]EMS36395.1 pyruvate dehydrogenase complex dihydrolipoamide acetyltransferase [Candidatus Liberibacter americanus PW_SP]